MAPPRTVFDQCWAAEVRSLQEGMRETGAGIGRHQADTLLVLSMPLMTTEVL